ncbi:MFS transporter [Vallitalea sediminicola]
MNESMDNKKSVSTLRYSLGILGLQIPSQAFTVFLLYYYVDTLNLAVGLAALGRGIFSVWDAVDNILFGYLSDNTRTKWGRRKPWIIGALPFYIIFFIMVFSTPAGFTEGNKLFWYFTIIIFLYETFATILWGNYGALFPELFRKSSLRAKASGFKQVFAIIGTIIGMAVTPIIYKSIGFTMMAVIYGIIGALILLYSILGSHEDKTLINTPKIPFVKAFKETLSNKLFWIYSIAYTFIQFVFGLLIAALPFYAEYSLGLDSNETSLLMASIFIIAIPAVIIWTKLVKKIGASKTWLIGVAVIGITVIPLGFSYNFTTGIISGMLLGIGYCSVLISGEVITSEIIDKDAEKTGSRREAIYLSVYGFIIRISGVFQSIAFALIGVFYGYVNGDNPGPNPAGAFRFLMSVIPFVSLVIAFFIGILYRKEQKKY